MSGETSAPASFAAPAVVLEVGAAVRRPVRRFERLLGIANDLAYAGVHIEQFQNAKLILLWGTNAIASLDRAWAGALTLILIVMLLNLVARLVARIYAPKTRR